MVSYLLNKHRFFSMLFIIAFVNISFVGCYSSYEIVDGNYENVKISKIDYKDGNTFTFNERQYPEVYVKGDSLFYVNTYHNINSIPLPEIKSLYYSGIDRGKTSILLAGITIAIGLVITYFPIILYLFA